MAIQGVLPEIQSLGTQLGRGLGGGFSSGLSSSMNLHSEMAKKLAGEKVNKQQEKLNAIETGLGTIEQMRGLLSSAGPSNWVHGLFGGETTKNRAELESLGRSLIPLVSAGVPIRNQREFTEYAKTITNPNARQAELEGALNGIESLLSRSVEQGSERTSKPKSMKKSSKFDVNNPEHKKKAEQLYSTYKDKEKVREILSREFEF